MVFWLIVSSVPLATVIWWVCAHGLVAGSKRWGVSRRLRLAAHGVIASFFAFAAAGFIAVGGERVQGWPPPPLWATTATFVWYIAALPLCVAVAMAVGVWYLVSRWRARSARGTVADLGAAMASSSSASRVPDNGQLALSRRAFLGVAVAAPPVMTTIFTGKAMAELGEFRVRNFDVPVAGLPRDLHGVTIAHLSDVHIGHYTTTRMLQRVIEATNNLRADMICMTGDLIDFDVADLPEGIALLRKLDAPGGVACCEGNHDLFVDPSGVRAALQNSGAHYVRNERRVIKLRGVPIELSGIGWGEPSQIRASGLQTNAAQLWPGNTDASSGSRSVAPRRPDFGFCLHLAHHPHGFDLAELNSVDLTLAGHTHGGQLMLADRFGPANLVYKYVSGLYSKMDASGVRRHCIVNNGIGNWFPLRLAAPAEIGLIRLIPAGA